ncbi:MAG: oxidoreductase family protein [Pseudomonadales bacterium]
MSSKPDFPTSPAALTADWLTKALKPSFPNIAVEHFENTTIGVGSGFMGDLERVSLTSASNANHPKTVVVKFSSHFEATRILAGRMNYYGRELGFYEDCAKTAGVKTPTIYCQHFDAQNQHFVMVMEDLAPAVPTDQVVGNTLEQSEQVMLAFADLHGKWWNSPDLKQMAWTAPITHVTPIKESLIQLEASIQDAERTGRFDAYPNMKRLQPRLPPLFAMEPPQPEPYTLVHGDLRSDNIFFSPESPSDEPTIIDWQTAGIGQPMTDIARWLTQSIDIDLRRQHETDLLKLYHERLIANGVENYSYQKMLQEYEINLVVTLLMFSMSMDEIEQTSDRAAPLFHAMYSRLDAALIDWNVEKTLKILPYMIPFMKLGNWLKTTFN